MNQTIQTQALKQNSVLIGNRIPKDFFITSGIGESDITVHAGSYHLALKDAGIEKCNIMVYSSILPAIATEIQRPQLTHGSVMETIMACANTTKGQRATAGIIFGWLYNKKTKQKYGGIVCEYNGDKTEDEVKISLNASLNELYESYSNDYDLKDTRIITGSFTPKKEFGTAVVALCFTNHVIPTLPQEH